MSMSRPVIEWGVAHEILTRLHKHRAEVRFMNGRSSNGDVGPLQAHIQETIDYVEGLSKGEVGDEREAGAATNNRSTRSTVGERGEGDGIGGDRKTPGGKTVRKNRDG